MQCNYSIKHKFEEHEGCMEGRVQGSKGKRKNTLIKL